MEALEENISDKELSIMNRHIKSLLSIVVVMTLVIGVFGFASTPVAKAEEKYTFYIVSHGGAIDPFWAVVMKGMKDAKKLLPIKATYFGPEVASISELVNLLNSAIAAKPDGIAATITDPTAVEEPLRRAIKQGIPVIAINVADMRPKDQQIPYMFYIGQNEYLGGVQAGERILGETKLTGITISRGDVGIQEAGHVGLEARAKGFADALGKAGIEVDKLDITPRPEVGFEILRGYFTKHPETNALLTVGPQGTLPAVQLIREKGWANKILHATFDLDPVTLAAIREGITLFAIDQQQYMQGFLPMVYLYLYNEFGLVPGGDVLTGPGFVDKTNVELIAELIEQGYR